MTRITRQFACAPLTLGLLLIWLILEAIRVPVFGDSIAYFQALGLSRYGMASLCLWEPLTYGLIHNGWIHTLMNGLILLSVGSRIEWMLGGRSAALVILAGTLFGGLFHLALSANVLVGGSGTVFALVLAMTTLAPESRWLVPFPVSAKNLGRGLLSATLILVMINPSLGIPGLSQLGVRLVEAGLGSLFGISHACHLGGAAAGWLLARWILRTRVSLEELQRSRLKREGS